MEGEAILEETGGDDAAAFEDEFGFGAEEEGADLEHPVRGGETDGDAPSLAQGSHEFGVGEGIR